MAMVTLLLSFLLELCRISALPPWSCTVFALNVLECYVNPGFFTYTQAPGALLNSGVCTRFKLPAQGTSLDRLCQGTLIALNSSGVQIMAYFIHSG
jgi:hypothetical protein